MDNIFSFMMSFYLLFHLEKNSSIAMDELLENVNQYNQKS